MKHLGSRRIGWPFVTRARYDDLADRYGRVIAERDDAQRTADATARQANDADAELDRLREGSAARSAALQRRAEQLQHRLDQALGLDSQAVRDGAAWQMRRQRHMHLDRQGGGDA